MKIEMPTIGPIIGYTTDSQSRIWIRGDARFNGDGTSIRRCFGVLRFRKVGAKAWSRTIFCKLAPHFDMSGVFVLEELTQNTDYEYQTGWFIANAELTNINIMESESFQWPTEVGKFRSGATSKKQTRSYIVGSCRYMLRLFGGTIFDDRGDKCFQAVNRQIDEQNLRVDAMLMVGDQIYADDMNFLSPDTAIDQFLARYRTVFSQEGIRAVMARTPTYMILDDHEIEDNWPAKAGSSDRLTLYPHAIHAYQIYQCSHSPLFEVEKGKISGTLTKFWYQFSDGCADWFVMDVRTERIVDGPNKRIVSALQMNALLNWLADGSGRIKFVVSSVPFLPDLSSDAGDKWSAFVDQRDQIVEHVLQHQIRKVIFVSGDVHCSFTCKIECAEDPTFRVHQIVSSSLFWPYPHMEEEDFNFSGTLLTNSAHKYTVKLTSSVHSEDNFSRINASPSEVEVQFYSRKGEQLAKKGTKLPI